MKRIAITAILMVLVLALVAQPVMAAKPDKPADTDQMIISWDGGSCTCGGVNKVERWYGIGLKVYINTATLEWLGVGGIYGGIGSVIAGLAGVFGAPINPMLMVVGMYLIATGSLSNMAADIAENGIILYCTYFLPYPVYARAQASCDCSSGSSGGGGGGGHYFFETGTGDVE